MWSVEGKNSYGSLLLEYMYQVLRYIMCRTYKLDLKAKKHKNSIPPISPKTINENKISTNMLYIS